MAPAEPTSTFRSSQSDISDDSDADYGSLASNSSNVILGFPDGKLQEKNKDFLDWKISRIGGRPTFPLKDPPPISSADCPTCRGTMELIVQLYVPLPDSVHDRVLHVWGCTKKSCQQTGKSFRAFRSSCFNFEFAQDLEQTKKAEESSRKEKELEEQAARFNPFAASTGEGAPDAGGLGSLVFGGATASNVPSSSPPPTTKEAPSTTVLGKGKEPSTSTWPTTLPSFPSQYLTTLYEPPSNPPSIASSSSSKSSNHSFKGTSEALDQLEDALLAEQGNEPRHRDGKGSGRRTGSSNPNSKSGSKSQSKSNGPGPNSNWGGEKYERQSLLSIDDVFLKFQSRVELGGGENSGQVVRYDFGGLPLAFVGKGDVYEMIWPRSDLGNVGVTEIGKGSTMNGSSSKKGGGAGAGPPRVYHPGRVPKCRKCGSGRVFELQLMPALAGAIEPFLPKIKTQDEKQQEAGSDKKEERTIDWATAFVFSCEKDCRDGEEDGWAEEVVLMQLEQ